MQTSPTSGTLTHMRSSLLIAAAALACAPPVTVSTGPEAGTADAVLSPDQPWPVRTREHVDLWLHGFAMLQDDTALVPLFRREYRNDMLVARNAANVYTTLDDNRERLRQGFVRSPYLFNAQFVPLYFGSGADLAQAIEYFLRAEGNPQAAGSREVATIIQVLAGYFPSAYDRDWLRTFWQSIGEESNRFYRAHWIREQQNRRAALEAVDSLWQRVYRPRLDTYIRNTQQARGSLLLSLPLGGEGRTLNLPITGTLIAVNFPETRAQALEAIYAAVHELAIAVTQTAVTDNITPTEQRDGLGARYQNAAAVRGGAILLQRVAPELVDGYRRYYLREANRPAGANVQTSFANVFSIPETIRAAIESQMEVVLGGI
jgi:hypothetical protein